MFGRVDLLMSSRLAPSANFHNPVGLLWRMLTSGQRAAYSALVHEALRIALRPVDWMLQPVERRLLRRSASSERPILLVVGAPRSGTTLVYQTLARYLDVSVLTNAAAMFPRSPLCGSRLTRWLPAWGASDFRSFYGQTSGLQGANDGFSLWNRWLGDDRYVPASQLTPEGEESMRQFFLSWHALHDRPFLNKNNRNTACLDLLSRVLPQARFIVVRRNPLLVAQSLITARQQVQGDKSVGWGLHSHSADTPSDPLQYVDDVCDQIIEIERQLDEQLRHIEADRITEITYEGFCEAPQAALRTIIRDCAGVTLREELMDAELTTFEVSARVTMSDAEQERLQSRLAAKRRKTVVV
jgi:hypothetical protein